VDHARISTWARVRGVDIFLVRSSLTIDKGAVDDATVPDAQRHLSADGRQIIRALGNKLRLSEEPTFDRFVTSPLPAAVQTAELFADRVDYVGVIEVLPALSSNVPPQVIAPLLLARGSSIVVVGDEPALSSLGAFLVGRTTFPPLMHGQVSVIHDRQPAWCLRPGDLARQLLLVA
jgi:phosphohistidine phosphatase SixA